MLRVSQDTTTERRCDCQVRDHSHATDPTLAEMHSREQMGDERLWTGYVQRRQPEAKADISRPHTPIGSVTFPNGYRSSQSRAYGPGLEGMDATNA